MVLIGTIAFRNAKRVAGVRRFVSKTSQTADLARAYRLAKH